MLVILRALALCSKVAVRKALTASLRLLGDIAAHRNPPESALGESYYRQAVAVTEELGMHPLLAHCHLGLGNLYAKIGQPGKACVELSTVVGLYRAMDMTFWLPQAEAALTQAGSSLALPTHREP